MFIPAFAWLIARVTFMMSPRRESTVATPLSCDGAGVDEARLHVPRWVRCAGPVHVGPVNKWQFPSAGQSEEQRASTARMFAGRRTRNWSAVLRNLNPPTHTIAPPVMPAICAGVVTRRGGRANR